MTLSFTKPMMLIALCGLAACGGSGGGESGGGGGGNGGGTGGTGDPIPGTISDANPISQTTRVANFQIGSNASIAQSASITLDAGFLGGAVNGTVQIFGQSVTITNGGGTVNGQDVRVEIDPSRAGTYAVPVSVFSYGPDLTATNPAGGEAPFVAGLETDVSVVNGHSSGTVNYVGDFAADGVLRNGGGSQRNELEGQMTVTVSFGGTSTATATFDGNSQASIGGSTSVDLSLASTALSGNGFAGALTCAGSCIGNGSAIDATFYGPGAEEIGGVIAVNVTRGSDTYQGAGTFVIAGQ